MKIDKDGWTDSSGDHAAELYVKKESPNQSGPLNPDNMKFIVAHWTGGSSFDGAMTWLSNPVSKASAHFVVGRNGKVGQLVSLLKTAHHAGESSWQLPPSRSSLTGTAITKINRYSIGIEFVNLGRLKKTEGGKFVSASGSEVESPDVLLGDDGKFYQRYPEEQINAGLALMLAIKEFHAGIVELIGHSDIAPKRKNDPGPEFPFEFLRARLFGRGELNDV